MENLDAEIISWLEFAKGGPGSGAQGGHPFEGNQYTSSTGKPLLPNGHDFHPNGRPQAFAGQGQSPFTGNEWPPKNWGDRNNTPEALSGITAKDHASDWNQVKMTDTAAKIMEAESRHFDAHPYAPVGKPDMSGDERSADAIPKWLVQSATPKDLDALTDNNFHSSVRYIESQRPDLAQ